MFLYTLHLEITLYKIYLWFDLCVQVQHQDLKSSHDQLALTLEDHKSALAAAQVEQQQQHRDADSLLSAFTQYNS